jgi:hypothetical protein
MIVRDLKVVPDLMDGKSAVAFMRDLKLARDPEKAGGFRPDVKALEKWLKENHPALVGTKFNDLPEPLQKAFKKQYKPESDPEIAAQAERDNWAGFRLHLARQQQKPTWPEIFHMDNPEHVEILTALKELMTEQAKQFGEALKGQPKTKKPRKSRNHRRPK